MKSFTFALITIALCSLASALNITYPTAGAHVDRAKTFNITWDVANDDPVKPDSLNIFATFQDTSLTQTIAQNVSASALKYEVPAFKLIDVGEATIIMNTLGTQGNLLTATVLVLVVSTSANSTETAVPSASSTGMSSASSSGVAHPVLSPNDGIVGAFVAWLAATGISALI